MQAGRCAPGTLALQLTLRALWALSYPPNPTPPLPSPAQRGAVLSYGVVIDRRHVVPPYARISLYRPLAAAGAASDGGSEDGLGGGGGGGGLGGCGGTGGEARGGVGWLDARYYIPLPPFAGKNR